MSDVFSLVPEGQAWTDYNAKPANREDYDPKFFAGSLTAIPQGVASGAVGLGQTVTSFGKQLISDPDVMNQFAPSYGVVKALFPDADEALNDSYDKAASALTAAQKGVKPEANSQGTAAQVLYGLGQFVPAIGATIVGGPAAGGAVAFGSTYEPTRQEFLEKGVDADTAGTLAAIQGTANAFGMALPAGVGGTLATRLLSGAGINTGFGMANRFAVGETLDSHGYKELSQQYRAWDGQAMLIDGVLGLAFGGVHHWNASRAGDGSESVPPTDDVSPVAESGDQPTPVGNDIPPAANESPLPSSDPQVTPNSAPSVDIDSLRASAGQILSRGDRKVWQSEVANGERILGRLNEQRAAILEEQVRGSGKALSAARADKQRRLGDIDRQIASAEERTQYARDVLEPNMPGGEYFEARAELSRLQQSIKPSDVDAAHVMNEGLYYDIEASPVLHGSTASLNAHVAAMDEASRALMSGEPVNVSQQIRGLDGITRPDAISGAPDDHAAVRQTLDENGVDYSERSEPAVTAPDVRPESAFSRASDETGQVSTDPDTGDVISSNSYDLLAARDMAAVNPDAKVLHPDTGKEVTLAEALSDLDGQLATVQKESKVYSAAAACFLRNL
ncbi:TPA: hypothetical protein ACGCBI_002189 [Serratia marcescens]|uniref:Phage protein n=1 Tax=Serratia marcescens TaxID=615 RepID=A0A345IRI8_SERMA|nr:hypothetical protein [Serratia marcescens]AXH02460.1 phage protein [Serratia marcescens]MBN5442949.1 hypothetical protein [Serratia marcescens]RLO48242.1 hypothetical protein CLM66_18050 [Serratia marcescens]RLO51440.1 hypothetical protein CLM67_03450 [Serratia marcescens]